MQLTEPSERYRQRLNVCGCSAVSVGQTVRLTQDRLIVRASAHAGAAMEDRAGHHSMLACLEKEELVASGYEGSGIGGYRSKVRCAWQETVDDHLVGHYA